MSEFLRRIWGIDALFVDENSDTNLDAQSAVIVLSVNSKNYDRYLGLVTFRQILKNSDLSKYAIQSAQIGILNAVRTLKIKRDELIFGLNELARNAIISDDEFGLLREFLLALKIAEFDRSNLTFHSNLTSLNEICAELLKLADDAAKNRLNLARKNADEKRFFVSVTGVINAGKSSTLNALIGERILGVSNVPETANLTILSYDEKPSVRVEFWDEQILAQMGLDSANLGGEFSKNIEFSELTGYTSASAPLARYVKEINLGLNLELLRDKICIVDTPGLDDAVVWREEATKNYMQKSDFIIHLMNVAQTASKKDVSFICDTLANSKNGGLIVVLTHADLLNQNELNDALNYTKKSIEFELEQCGLNLDVQYFVISAKTGFGISELKNYIYEKLFSANGKKAKIIIDNYKKELNFIADSMIDEAEFKLQIINGDQDKTKELEAQIINKLENLDANSKELEKNINELLQNLKSNKYSPSAVKSIISRIKDRIIADVKYADSKKQKLDFTRLGIICESGFNDLFTDLFREFKQKLIKDTTTFYEKIKLKFGVRELEFGAFDIKKYFDENMPRIGFTELKSKLNVIIKNKFDLENQILSLFSDFIAKLDLPVLLDDLAVACTKDFINDLNLEISSAKAELNAQKIELSKLISKAKESKTSKENLISILSDNLQNLQNIKANLDLC